MPFPSDSYPDSPTPNTDALMNAEVSPLRIEDSLHVVGYRAIVEQLQRIGETLERIDREHLTVTGEPLGNAISTELYIDAPRRHQELRLDLDHLAGAIGRAGAGR